MILKLSLILSTIWYHMYFRKEKFQKAPTNNLPGFNIEQSPLESSTGGTLIYISQNLSYKPRKDLQIYCPKELDSTFI